MGELTACTKCGAEAECRPFGVFFRMRCGACIAAELAPFKPWDWEREIRASVAPADAWMADKFIGKLMEHKRRFPAFKADRVAAMFLDAPPKVRAYYCYQPVESFTKVIQKGRSIASQAAGQS